MTDNTSGNKKPCVFIQTNAKQIVGATVAEHSFRRFSEHNDKFDIRLMDNRDFPFFAAKEGKEFLRNGVYRRWEMADLQSFTPTRFMPPELMGYVGRAVVVDPDVFALDDVWKLFEMDMQGKAIWCRPRKSGSTDINGNMATSVMLLDCDKLKHWKVEEQFNSMFEGQLDYKDWVPLRNEPRDSIGLLDESWNHLDVLTKDTHFLHTTKRITQPWKTGLPVDFRPSDKFNKIPVVGWAMTMRRKLFGEYALLGRYRQNPDMNQQHFFFGLLKECLDEGRIDLKELKKEMKLNHVRHDAEAVLEETPPLMKTIAGLPA
ncbi:MAG: hypothetical protein ACI97A_001327 [Planctomycetota bacterium]|jgi:hypothetical protein